MVYIIHLQTSCEAINEGEKITMHKDGLLGGDGLKTFAELALTIQHDAVVEIVEQNGKRAAMAIIVTDSEGNEVASWTYNHEEWDPGRDFMRIARGKAMAAARVGVDTGLVATQAPQYFRPGDPPFRGAKVFSDYIVAASGIQAELDEIISDLVGTTMQACIWGAFFRETADDPDFLGLDGPLLSAPPGGEATPDAPA